MNYVVSGNGKLSIGNEYEVRHERKGTFSMLVDAIDGEWISGEITKGVARAIMRYNVCEVGERITIRSCHSYFIPMPAKKRTK